MRAFERFAGSFPEALVLAALFAALPVAAADLRPASDASRIVRAFPARAKVRVLNVWATWCVPCVAEMADLRAIDAAFGAEVAIVGVSLDDMIPDAKQETTATFLDRQKIAFPNLYYTGNPDALGEVLDFNGEIPVTIVYDDRGNEVWRHQGRLDGAETIARLRGMLRRTK